MDKAFKPAGYNSVSPYLIVNGAQKLIDLLVKVFDAKEKRRFGTPDGKIMHAEIQLDDSIIMLADSTDRFPPNQFLIHVYVQDVDKTFQEAIACGCEAIEQPSQREGEPNRRGSFKDFAGNNWSVGTQQ
jgi:uncharacterized glyoxalase superfamily protein PhnB